MLKVSVAMITYNHELYIKQAIDSILMQNVNFDYEIVIGEDCSPDNTREILKEYKEKYPDKIKLILHEQNIGVRQNCIEVYKKCYGEYIALLEGDDFWTDTDKLQKSIDFLENNKEYIAIAHDVNIINENSIKISDSPFGQYKGDLNTPKDQFKYNNIPTLSLVFRNIWGKQLTDVIGKIMENVVMIGDYPLKLLLLTKGKIKYFNCKMGTYRWVRTTGTSFSAQAEKNKEKFRYDVVNFLNNLYNMDTKYKKIFENKLIRVENGLIIDLKSEGKKEEVNKFINERIKNKKFKYKVKMYIYRVLQIVKRKLLK